MGAEHLLHFTGTYHFVDFLYDLIGLLTDLVVLMFVASQAVVEAGLDVGG